jgi:hypothetical protein
MSSQPGLREREKQGVRQTRDTRSKHLKRQGRGAVGGGWKGAVLLIRGPGGLNRSLAKKRKCGREAKPSLEAAIVGGEGGGVGGGAPSHCSKAVDLEADLREAIMASCSSRVMEPCTHESMVVSTSAPVLPMMTPTRLSCSAMEKCSAKSGHSSCSSALQWGGRKGRTVCGCGCGGWGSDSVEGRA